MPLPPPRSQPGDTLPADAPGGAQALVNSLPPPGRGEREGWRPLRPRKATGEAEVAAVPLPGGGRIGPGASGDSSDSGSSQAQPQPNFGPIVLGPGPQSAPPINELVGPDGQEQILVAMRRLRDSGALHRLTPQELLHVTELMPNSAGVRDANRIVQEQLGISLDEFLSRYLPH